MVEITDVLPKSRAEAHGVIRGDILLKINGHDINDVLDYRFYLAENEINITVRRGDEEKEFFIIKGEYEDIGLDFERPLMDEKHSCENKCVFCFIDQLPKGMRKSLYFKDDDSRLSFLHGNYITLTNLTDGDIDRIINMHISPVNISVHTTNPALRRKMMLNKRSGEVLSYLSRLSEAGIKLCTQVVLCRGLNDGDELIRTMKDLAKLHPSMQSCSIVPAGLTKFRDGLYPLSPYSKEECKEIIKTVEAFSDECMEKYGSRLFFCADELYIRAEIPLHDDEYYEEYSQIENGVGMITSLKTEFEFDLKQNIDFYRENFKKKYPLGREISIATGVAAYDSIKELAEKIENSVENIKINVYKIINYFFGESITVSGLLTGKDMSEQILGMPLGDALFIPHNTLKADEDIFLDDMTPDELQEKLGVTVLSAPEDGAELISALLDIE